MYIRTICPACLTTGMQPATTASVSRAELGVSLQKDLTSAPLSLRG